MAAKAKKQAKATPKKKEVKASRRKTNQKGKVSGKSDEMKAQRKEHDSKKTGERKTGKQRDVKNQGTASRSVSKNPRRRKPGLKVGSVVRRSRKPSSATETPAPADAGMPAGLGTLGG
ncbi:MAG TPA: hypothetical protein VE153_32725 [Myxococcus sp.]|jgi:hypothetical protein|nr:hypothetical protein [Myxococcus sp.]